MNKAQYFIILAAVFLSAKVKADIGYDKAFLLLPKVAPEDGGYGELLEVEYKNLGIIKSGQNLDSNLDEDDKLHSLFSKFTKSIYDNDIDSLDESFSFKEGDRRVVTKEGLISLAKFKSFILFGALKYKEQEYLLIAGSNLDGELNVAFPILFEEKKGEYVFVSGALNKDLYGLLKVLRYSYNGINLPVALRE